MAAMATILHFELATVFEVAVKYTTQEGYTKTVYSRYERDLLQGALL